MVFFLFDASCDGIYDEYSAGSLHNGGLEIFLIELMCVYHDEFSSIADSINRMADTVEAMKQKRTGSGGDKE